MANNRTGEDYLKRKLKKKIGGPEVDTSGAPLDPGLYLAWLKKEEEKRKKRAGSGIRKGKITLL